MEAKRYWYCKGDKFSQLEYTNSNRSSLTIASFKMFIFIFISEIYFWFIYISLRFAWLPVSCRRERIKTISCTICIYWSVYDASLINKERKPRLAWPQWRPVYFHKESIASGRIGALIRYRNWFHWRKRAVYRRRKFHQTRCRRDHRVAVRWRSACWAAEIHLTKITNDAVRSRSHF